MRNTPGRAKCEQRPGHGMHGAVRMQQAERPGRAERSQMASCGLNLSATPQKATQGGRGPTAYSVVPMDNEGDMWLLIYAALWGCKESNQVDSL